MKISNQTKDVMILISICTLLCLVLIGVSNCAQKNDRERKEWVKKNPVEAAKERCYSKIRGSRPACWTEGDWIEFCKHVECKQTLTK